MKPIVRSRVTSTRRTALRPGPRVLFMPLSGQCPSYPTSIAKLEALDFAGRGLGQRIAEVDPARIFVGRKAALAGFEKLADEGGVALAGRLEHDERLRLGQPILVGAADDRGLEH